MKLSFLFKKKNIKLSLIYLIYLFPLETIAEVGVKNKEIILGTHAPLAGPYLSLIHI